MIIRDCFISYLMTPKFMEYTVSQIPEKLEIYSTPSTPPKKKKKKKPLSVL